MVIGLPERLASTVAPASASSEAGVTGIHMSSQISTPMVRPGTSTASNSRSTPNGAKVPSIAISASDAGAGGEVASLVELAIGRQIDLGHHSENGAPVDDHGAIIDPRTEAQRRTDDQDRHDLAGCLHDSGKSALDRIQERILHDQVFDGVARQAKLRKDRDGRRPGMADPGRLENGGRIGGRVGHPGDGDASGGTGEAVAIDRMKAHRGSTPPAAGSGDIAQRARRRKGRSALIRPNRYGCLAIHANSLSRRDKPEFCVVIAHRTDGGRREDRVPACTHGPSREKLRESAKPQVQAETLRPSLRSGFTAYT